MNKLKGTRQMTLFTLFLGLGVAIYLNWQYAKSGADLAVETSASAQYTQAEEFVQGTTSGDKNYGDAQLVSAVAASAGQKYFDQARLDRSRTRDEALDKLQKTLKNAKISTEEKAAATQQLTDTIAAMTTEADIENLVKAKGFTDCVAYIGDGNITVTVYCPGGSLTSAQVAQIRDIVLGKAEVTAQNLNIIEVK